MLALIAGAFAGGFYVGFKYHEQEMVKNPERFLDEYGEELKRTAKSKYEKIKKVLLEDEE